MNPPKDDIVCYIGLPVAKRTAAVVFAAADLLASDVLASDFFAAAAVLAVADV